MKLKLLILVLLPFIIHCSSNKKEEVPNTSKEFEVVEEFRIDNPEDIEEFYFASVSHLAIGKNGNIFVGDDQMPTVSMFNNQGSFIKTIGKEGRGPGEYLGFGGLEVLQDGRLAIWAQRNSRVNYYSANGDFLSSEIVPAGLFTKKVFEKGFNDNIYLKRNVFDSENRNTRHEIWVEYSETGESLDTLFIPRERSADKLYYVLWTNSGDAYPFIETNITAMHPSGFLITGNNSEYSIKRLYSDSSEIRYQRNIPKAKLNEEESSQWKKFNSGYGVQNDIPDSKPYFKDIQIDSDGRVWVWRYVEAMQRSDVYPRLENSWWEQPTFDVFLESGEFYGTVKLPFNAEFMEAKGENVWAIHTDENGEETVVQYKLSAI
ncbi:MAG: 6-bladed beta-propeller [Balneola sp.]